MSKTTSPRPFHAALSALVAPLVNVVRVWTPTCPRTGTQFAEVAESNGVVTRWRYDAANGFVYCGEVY